MHFMFLLILQQQQKSLYSSLKSSEDLHEELQTALQ